MTPGPTTPGLVHSVLLASRAKLRWCVGKQVRTSFHWLLAGSYMPRWRLAPPFSGNALAAGCSEPALQKSGFGSGEMREVNQVRPFSSIIGLWFSVLLSQMGCGPHTADGPNGAFFVDGVAGSRTGCSISVALCATGSITGT